MGHHSGRYGGGHHGRRQYRDDGNPSDYSRQRAVTTQAPVCGKCGRANLVEARFCEQCGTPMSAATCEGCSAELAPGAKFCSRCGRPHSGSRRVEIAS